MIKLQSVYVCLVILLYIYRINNYHIILVRLRRLYQNFVELDLNRVDLDLILQRIAWITRV